MMSVPVDTSSIYASLRLKKDFLLAFALETSVFFWFVFIEKLHKADHVAFLSFPVAGHRDVGGR